jgi:hypothetical protein
LKEHDPVARIHFCNWFLQSVYDGEVDSQLVFFSSEAKFSLHGGVNYQNSHWSAEDPGLFTNSLFMTKKIGVRCAMNACCEISTVLGQELQGVNNGVRLYTYSIRSGGQQFQHLL